MPAETMNSPVRDYFRGVYNGLATAFIGMRLTIKYFFRRPMTLQYPEERPLVPPGHRGIHGYDEEKCISCDMCANACPVSCIYIKSAGRGKDAMMTQFDIDYTKCLFCDLCTPPCPTECIWMTQEFDLASYSKADCIVNFATMKTADQIAEHEKQLAAKEAEKKAKAAAKKDAPAAAPAPKTEAKPEATAAPAAASPVAEAAPAAPAPEPKPEPAAAPAAKPAPAPAAETKAEAQLEMPLGEEAHEEGEEGELDGEEGEAKSDGEGDKSRSKKRRSRGKKK